MNYNNYKRISKNCKKLLRNYKINYNWLKKSKKNLKNKPKPYLKNKIEQKN